MRTQTELIEKARRGERITVEEAPHSLFGEERITAVHEHKDRTIVCDGDHDVVECLRCGRQSVVPCNFDEDCS